VYAHIRLCANDVPSLGSVRSVDQGSARDVGCVDDVAVFDVWGSLEGDGGSCGFGGWWLGERDGCVEGGGGEEGGMLTEEGIVIVTMWEGLLS
jgi:hypothetical protein